MFLLIVLVPFAVTFEVFEISDLFNPILDLYELKKSFLPTFTMSAKLIPLLPSDVSRKRAYEKNRTSINLPLEIRFRSPPYLLMPSLRDAHPLTGLSQDLTHPKLACCDESSYAFCK
ncbi:hypothetical protein F5Y11DRAFT_170271 [Daldinia sp. FL1419]|nr:hypothetical protein F5Y11DRAFT_170271 [Daldinia sp. FL1419]